MYLMSLGVTASARALPSAAAYALPPFTLAGDARSVRRPGRPETGIGLGKNEYDEKREHIEVDLDKADSELEQAEARFRRARQDAGRLLTKVQRGRETIQKFQTLITAMPDSSEFTFGDFTMDALNSGENMAGTLASQSCHINRVAGEIADSSEQVFLAAEINESTATATNYMIGTIGWTVEQVYPQMGPVVESLALPTELEVRDDLSAWLGSLDPLLKSKYLEAHSNYEDEEYMSAAHAMREVLSHILKEVLAPDSKVKAADGWKQEPGTNGPTQRQRIRFVALGSFVDDGVPEEELEAVSRLMDAGREVYQNLSHIAHERLGEWERRRVRDYMAIAESVLSQIKVLAFSATED
jgi:hypothetical protein